MQVWLDHCEKNLSEADQQEVMFLENKQGEVALDLARRIIFNKDSEGVSDDMIQIFELLNDKHKIYEHKRDNLVQVLITDQEKINLQKERDKERLVAL